MQTPNELSKWAEYYLTVGLRPIYRLQLFILTTFSTPNTSNNSINYNYVASPVVLRNTGSPTLSYADAAFTRFRLPNRHTRFRDTTLVHCTVSAIYHFFLPTPNCVLIYMIFSAKNEFRDSFLEHSILIYCLSTRLRLRVANNANDKKR